VQPSSVKLFTSATKEVLPPPGEACIVVTTYSMVCHGGRRSASGEMMINSISGREWGLMILDEVHVAPADMFQKVVHMVNAHCKLGLTATLVREDNKIKDLSFLVGPKLYEANWIDLTNDGYLARVQCVEVWCPMTKEFYAEYIRRSVGNNSRLQRLLYTLNPRKFRACEYLVNFHAKRGDKIIIFSDDVPALMLYCEALTTNTRAIPYIYGGTKENDRRELLNSFKTSALHSCIGLSKVGDTALDIPEANVIIQISSHFGARRQEAQRLGRILRPKPNPTGGFNAFFYTLISTDTKEMYFSTKRQQYLIDQGYTFKVVQDLADIADRESVLLTTVDQEVQLLNKVICFNYSQYDEEEDKQLKRKTIGEVDDGDDDGAAGGSGKAEVRRRSGKLSAVSGAGETVYKEFDV
jgi:DNA excision repair protein ERCC-3